MKNLERKIIETLISQVFLVRFDLQGNDHVLISGEANLDDLYGIEGFRNSSYFEAYENHIHLLRKIPIFSWKALKRDCPLFGMVLRNLLMKQYPQKHFRIYVFLDIFQGLIVRFHEKREQESNWSNEEERKTWKVFLIFES